MFLFKGIVAGIILLLPIGSIASTADELNAAVLNATIQVMRECYDVKHTANAEFAKCMADTLKQVVNPNDYRVFVTGDVPGNADLTIVNGANNIITCTVSAQKTIKVSQCSSHQGPPQNPQQKTSITPP